MANNFITTITTVNVLCCIISTLIFKSCAAIIACGIISILIIGLVVILTKYNKNDNKYNEAARDISYILFLLFIVYLLFNYMPLTNIYVPYIITNIVVLTIVHAIFDEIRTTIACKNKYKNTKFIMYVTLVAAVLAIVLMIAFIGNHIYLLLIITSFTAIITATSIILQNLNFSPYYNYGK